MDEAAVTVRVAAGPEADAALALAFKGLTGKARGKAASVRVKGREVTVPEAAAGVARFTFADLCAQPLGASDYMAVARSFHTVILADIPIMSAETRNEAKRFITLIDILYERHVKLLMSAEAEVIALYVAERGHEAAEFARTASRLIEMRGAEYLALPHGEIDSAASGATTSRRFTLLRWCIRAVFSCPT